MDAALSAISLLLSDPLLRDRMGSAASKRAMDRFDRSVISSQYRLLFDELSLERIRANQDAGGVQARPNCHLPAIDPVSLFRSFSSHDASPMDVNKPPSPLVQQGRRAMWDFLRLSTPSTFHDELKNDLFGKHG